MAKKKQDEKTYPIDEALELVKTSGKEKFDASVEVHINLGIDLEKQDQAVRTTTTLPNGTGQTKKVAVFSSKKVPEADIQLTEADLKKIEKGTLKPGTDFDVIVSEPKYMAKIATVAKVLGPQGMMPNPKSGTVTEDVEKAVKQIKKGKIEIRNEFSAPIIHTILGKKSFEVKALKENFEEVMSAVNGARPQKVRPENYIESVYVCSSMGPSFKVS
jgi:large subunit ribosomal protein L1